MTTATHSNGRYIVVEPLFDGVVQMQDCCAWHTGERQQPTFERRCGRGSSQAHNGNTSHNVPAVHFPTTPVPFPEPLGGFPWVIEAVLSISMNHTKSYFHGLVFKLDNPANQLEGTLGFYFYRRKKRETGHFCNICKVLGAFLLFIQKFWGISATDF